MMTFINRERELKFLEERFSSKEAELIILYGRRRIGKTELILNFCKGKKYMYFIGRLESREGTLKRFNNLLIENFNDKNILNNPFTNWDGIFDYVAEKARGRIVLVFDEFPFLAERFPEIISILQDKWDSKLKFSEIMLILCGSSISMMEKYTLDLKSPLYGRRTGQWKIEKMDAPCLKKFFPKYSAEEIIKLYSCLDTIPGYLVKFSQDKDVLENIRDRIFSKGEFLYEEIEILLREEFRDPSNYMSIISSIAGGLTKFSDIYDRTRLDKSLLSKYLYTLESLGIIERIMPVTENYKSKLKSKGSLYLLKDNFFDFWFRFVYLYRQELEMGETKNVLEAAKQEINSYISRKFEKLVLELIPLTKIGPYNRFGRWWNKNTEIDCVALDEKSHNILLVECKWKERVDAREILKELEEKSKRVEWKSNNRIESYAIFSKSFLKKIKEYNGKKVSCFDLKDIDKILKKG